MRGVASTLEKHHRVQLLDEALEAAVRLSHRYIPARQLPDKAVSLLDTACARVAVSQHATPAEVEDCQRRIEALETELGIIGREEAVGIDTAERARRRRRAARRRAERGSRSCEARWQAEKALVDQHPRPARQAARRSRPVEGTGSTLEPTAAEQPQPATRRGRRRRSPRRARQLLAELDDAAGASSRELQGETPADPADASTSRRSPRWSRTGPASRSAAW